MNDTHTSRSTDSKPLLLRCLMLVFNLAGMLAMGIALLALIVWITGRVVSDRYEWSQWIAWTPTPAAIAVALLGLIGSLRPGGPRRRRIIRRISWAVTLLGLLIWFALFEHHLLTTRRCDQPGLRIVHWNATSIKRVDRPNAADIVVELDADICLLTHPDRLMRYKPFRDWATADRTAYLPYPFAVITDLPIVEIRTIVSSEQMNLLLVRIDASASIGRELTIWLIDLPSDPEQLRIETARQLRQWIDKANLPPADLIAGDFNMTRGSASLDVIAPGHRHAFNAAGVGYGATYPREFPWLHIDHILISDAIDPLSYCIIDPHAGTHRLQLMTLNKNQSD